MHVSFYLCICIYICRERERETEREREGGRGRETCLMRPAPNSLNPKLKPKQPRAANQVMKGKYRKTAETCPGLLVSGRGQGHGLGLDDPKLSTVILAKQLTLILLEASWDLISSCSRTVTISCTG